MSSRGILLPKGEIYTIIGRDWHRIGNTGYNYTVYVIEQGPRQFIMGASGLKLFRAYRETILEDSLFEI